MNPHSILSAHRSVIARAFFIMPCQRLHQRIKSASPSSATLTKANTAQAVKDSVKVEASFVPDTTTDLDHPASSRSLKRVKFHVSADPYPDFNHPTAAEAREVYDILSTSLNGRVPARSARVTSTNSAATCGNTRNVIDSLIGTILSQNTSSRNSSTAKRSLDARFGKHNFEAIADAPLADVVDALRHGGLANKKGATIQRLLHSIKQKHGNYSLQHLACSTDVKSNDEIMEELMSYDGVGPKTAACVLLFCIGRDSFAVDTHVFRLSKLLGWVPKNADRVKAQAHLDRRIPDESKYGLHVMMIRHGKACKGCKKEGAKGECVLKRWVNGES